MMNLIHLRAGALSATINLSLGANCIRLRDENTGARILRAPDYAAGLDNPFLYGMPLLFPVNRISGARFTFEGREYVFPVNEPATGCHIHGELHGMPFEAEERSESAVTCVYRATAEAPYLAFPHAFELRVRYALSDAALSQEVRIKNCSDANMPVLLGFHTSFAVPFIDGGRVLLQDSVADGYERDASYLPTGRLLPDDAAAAAMRAGDFKAGESAFSRHFRVAPPNRAVLYDPVHDVSVVYDNDEKYAYRLTFTSGADFLCIEPMTCLVNCVNLAPGGVETGFDFVAPGSEKTWRSTITLLRGDARTGVCEGINFM